MDGRLAPAARATARRPTTEQHMATTTTTLDHRIAQPMSVRLPLMVPGDHATRLDTWQGDDRRRNDRRSDRLERPDLRILLVH
jgi:hypothetical protein